MPFNWSWFTLHEVLYNPTTGEMRIIYRYKFFFIVIKIFRQDDTGYSIKIFRREVNYLKFKKYWNTQIPVTDQTVIGYAEKYAYKIFYECSEVLKF
jgi:hypothetical protein